LIKKGWKSYFSRKVSQVVFAHKIELSKAESLKLGVNSMSNLNAQSVQLQGTLYIGFPKTFSCAHMENYSKAVIWQAFRPHQIR